MKKKLTRREFVASTVAASTLVGSGLALGAQADSRGSQKEIFERLKAEYQKWESQVLKPRPARTP
jgi:hypothetical protein